MWPYGDVALSDLAIVDMAQSDLASVDVAQSDLATRAHLSFFSVVVEFAVVEAFDLGCCSNGHLNVMCSDCPQ